MIPHIPAYHTVKPSRYHIFPRIAQQSLHDTTFSSVSHSKAFTIPHIPAYRTAKPSRYHIFQRIAQQSLYDTTYSSVSHSKAFTIPRIPAYRTAKPSRYHIFHVSPSKADLALSFAHVKDINVSRFDSFFLK